MTRQEIEQEYEVSDCGIIESLGKFESEAVYAPHFYQLMLEGFSDIMDWPGECRTDIFEVDAEDRKEFGIDPSTFAIALEESDQGFVSCTELTKEAFDGLVARNESAWEEESESVDD